MKNVAVLGCGPTGLLVAHAVQQSGNCAHIISKKVKSEIPGSQHLHGSVPGLTSQYPEGTIQFVRLGTAREYARKVYGDPDRETGWNNYLQVFPSWNVVKAYDRLWESWEGDISDMEVTVGLIPHILETYDLVISTIPAQVLCVNETHTFDGERYYIKKLPTPEADKEHEIVVYNGLPGDPWYRWSILGGLCSMESMDETLWTHPHNVNVIEGYKAIGNNCDCWPTIKRCGRWAEWRHGVIMYKSYLKAADIMSRLEA